MTLKLDLKFQSLITTFSSIAYKLIMCEIQDSRPMRIAKAIYPHLRQLADEFDVLLEKGDISELMRKCYIASKDESFTAVLEEAVRNNPVCIRLLYMEFDLYFSSMFFFFFLFLSICYSCFISFSGSTEDRHDKWRREKRT